MPLGCAAAALAAPGLEAFPGRHTGDQQCGDRVEPPPAEEGVPGEADEDGAGEVRAEEVLGALAVGGCRAERRSKALLGDPEKGIPTRLVAVSTIPSALMSGWWPVTRCRMASKAT
jgi:hypothetical protein